MRELRDSRAALLVRHNATDEAELLARLRAALAGPDLLELQEATDPAVVAKLWAARHSRSTELALLRN